MVKAGETAAVSGLIVFGTICSLFAKIVYEVKATGLDGKVKYFHKPWAMTSIMFFGMSFCLPYAYWQAAQEKKKKQAAGTDVEEPLLGPDGPIEKRPEWQVMALLALPTFFDLVATILMNVGLLYVTASVYQMMRGAEMLFAALFAVVFLKRRLNKFHYLGIACCVAGIGLVGMSSILSGEGSATQRISQEQMLMGMGLIIVSQAVQAAQLTFEDFFMADLDVPGPKIVGVEGVYGLFIALAIVAPISHYLPGNEGEGIHEDFLDTWAMIKSSRTLQVILAINSVSVLMYNISGMEVTGHLGAVFRTVLETMRTLFVWLVDLLLYYTPLGQGLVGESWSVYSWLQAVGFVVLVTGTLVYRRGDDEAARQELAEALVQQATADGGGEEEPLLGPAGSGARAAVPVPVATRPVSMKPGSFRASQTIAGTSYSRSLTRGGIAYTPPQAPLPVPGVPVGRPGQRRLQPDSDEE